MTKYTLIVLYLFSLYDSTNQDRTLDELKEKIEEFQSDVNSKLSKLSKNLLYVYGAIGKVESQTFSFETFTQQVNRMQDKIDALSENQAGFKNLSDPWLIEISKVSLQIKELDTAVRDAVIKLWIVEQIPGYFRKLENSIQATETFRVASLTEENKFENVSNIWAKLVSTLSESVESFNKLQEDIKTVTKTLEKVIESNERNQESGQDRCLIQITALQQYYKAENTKIRETLQQNQNKMADTLNQILNRLSNTENNRQPLLNLGHEVNRTDGCAIRRLSGEKISGIVRIEKDRNYYNRYCDQVTDGGGWTVISRRGYYGNPQQNFTLSWDDYKRGFGDFNKEFWFGNDFLHRLTSEEKMILRVELQDFDNNLVIAEYKNFYVNSESSFYQLNISGYSGNASDSLSSHDGASFSTVDQKHDDTDICCPCAQTYGGGWWFYKCFEANLNGVWHADPMDNGYFRGIIWEHWRGDYSLYKAEMKVRPLWFHTRIRGL